jgi:hypothetical protein
MCFQKYVLGLLCYIIKTGWDLLIFNVIYGFQNTGLITSSNEF